MPQYTVISLISRQRKNDDCLFVSSFVGWLVGKLRSSAMVDYLLTWKIRKMREMVRVATFHED